MSPQDNQPTTPVATTSQAATDFASPSVPPGLATAKHALIYPAAPPPTPADEAESLDVWGFKDTTFAINAAGNVELTGKRYMLSGHEMPALLPWVQETFDAPVSATDRFASHYPPPVPPSRLTAPLHEALRQVLRADQITTADEERLRRGHGHTQAEMYAIKYGALERVPDVVLFPESEAEVVALVQLATQHDACIIPYGGGTSVSEALRCPATETRPILSVDLRRMNRILWIDPVNEVACIQAGAVGRHLVAQLAEHGFSLGHEPDSIEFSTLGGWIATHASGMKKNRYGNIEDLLLDARAVTPAGIISGNVAVPRKSIGPDPVRWLLGSEGSFGVITQATLRIFKKPEAQRYGSILFKTFDQGLQFLYALQQQGNIPASVRLVDNVQLQLNFVLKPPTAGLAKIKGRLQKLVVSQIKGFKRDQMVACTLVFEGSQAQVEAQERAVYALAKQFAGLKGGSENGERGYMLTYGIAYIRDWILNHYLIAESFETSAPWSCINTLIERVRTRVAAEHKARGLPGKPFVTARVTQIYPTGVCIYFYLAFYFKGVAQPSAVFHELEEAARDEILQAGGSISHHHGIGKLRQAFMPRVLSPAALQWRAGVKWALDPQNIMACGNLTLGDRAPAPAPATAAAAPTRPARKRASSKTAASRAAAATEGASS